MFKFMLFFAAGYYLGSGGKLPPKPEISVGADGSLIIKPPQANPTTQVDQQPVAPVAVNGYWW